MPFGTWPTAVSITMRWQELILVECPGRITRFTLEASQNARILVVVLKDAVRQVPVSFAMDQVQSETIQENSPPVLVSDCTLQQNPSKSALDP